MELKFDESAEISVLGSALNDKTCFLKACQQLEEMNFFFPQNQYVYSSMLDIYKTGSFPSYDSVKSHLTSNGLMDRVGNRLLEISHSGSISDFDYYVNVLKDQRFKSDFARIVKNVTTDFSKKGVDELCNLVDIVRNGGSSLDFLTIDDIDKNMNDGKGFISWLESRQEDFAMGSTIIGRSTGFCKIDETLCGLQKGYYYTIAAEPNGGKTTFALQIILSLIEKKVKCCVFSLEMTAQDTYIKMISIVSGISTKEIKSGNLNGIQYQHVHNACRFLKKYTDYLIITAEPLENLNSLKCYMQRAKDLCCEVVMIDYLQQIENKSFNPSESIKEVSSTIQKLLLKFQMSGLILSQFAKDSQNVGLSSDRLFGSSQIKKDSHAIMLLSPDFLSKTTMLYFDKEREGGKGTQVKLAFDGCKFSEMGPLSGVQYE